MSNCKWESPLTENCNKMSTASNLTLRTSTHIGDNFYKCDICGKEFYSAFNLKRHVKIHNRGNSFKCNICGKWFSTSSKLSVHAKTHMV